MANRNFFSELKRRNVYKVAVAYAVVSWLLIQAASILFPTFEAPSWVMKVFVAVSVLGFPIALVFSWAFEITPEGIKREEDVSPAESITPRTGRKLVGITIALAVLAAGLFAFRTWAPRAPTAPPSAASPAAAVPTAIPEKSIAVLPFENLSDDKQNAFFTDGVQDEILTDLAKIADLKVISRTSVMQYKTGVQRNLREIGQQLGVAHLLEGSVQRAAGKVRVNAQLIDARSDAHLWAENYDRPLDDVFAIQTEIAKTIADQLQARLSPNEKAAIEEKPTSDLQAYEQFVRGRDVVESYLDRTDQRADLMMAVDRLDDATRRDPGFELAYCYLARAHDLIFFLGFDPTPDRRAKAEAAIDHALRLRPDSGEAHLARAGHFLRCYRDYQSASSEIAIAGPSLPNSAPLYTLCGYIERRLGHWDNSTGEMEKAFDRDPRNPTTYDLLADNYILTRQFTKAAKMYREQAAHTGIDPRMAAVNLALVDFAVTGQTATTEAALANLPTYIDPGSGLTAPRILIALIRGDYAVASAALAASTQAYFQDVDFSFHYPRSWYEAQIARAEGDHARMVMAFAATRKIFEALPGYEGNPRIMAVVAQVDAGLGNNALSLQEAQHAVEQMPISRDAYDGPLVLQSLAQVYIITGDKEKAEETLETLLKVPGYLSYGYLLKDPMWAPLRNDARFQKIVHSLAPKTAVP